MRVGAVRVFMTIVALTGCSNDATGPVATTVAVTVFNATGPFFEQPSPSQMIISCGVEFRAHASGGGTATWLVASILFFAGPDRSVPVDSIRLSQADLRREWGADVIGSGTEQHSTWVLGATAPFGVEFRFAYRLSDGTVKTTSAAHRCGPSIQDGSAGPTVGSITLESPTGEVQPGDTLSLTYSATSPVGLWETRVIFSGACDSEFVTFELFAPTVARTLKLPVPTSCRLDEVLSVNVLALDIALRGDMGKVPAARTVVDRTRPLISLSFGFYGSQVPSGYYFGGDTMPAYVGASDNHALSVVHREVWPWGRRDSVRTSAPSILSRRDIPIAEDWSGRIQVRAYSRDAAGLVSDTIITPPDSFRIYPTVARPLVVSATAIDAIYDVIVDEARGVLYLRHPDALQVTVLSATDLTVLSSIPLPAPAYDFDLSTSGDSLVLTFATMRALGFVDLDASPRSVTTLQLNTLDTAYSQQPVRVRVAANGKALVVLGGATYLQTTVLEVDLASRVERLRTDAGDNGIVGYVTPVRSSDHQVVVLVGDGRLQRYDAAQDGFGPRLGMSSPAELFAVDRTGSRYALGLDVYDAGLQFERRVDSPDPDVTSAVALSPDGMVLYHSVPFRGLVRSDASDGHLLDRTRAPQAGRLRVSPDGTKLVLIGYRTVGLLDLR